MSLGLFAVQAYLAAGAYVQAHAGTGLTVSRPEAVPGAGNGSSFVPAPSVFFAAGADACPGAAWAPYRSPYMVRFPQTALPQGVVDYLLNQSLLTGRPYSLFRHGPASAPVRYEVSEGENETYDALEELFFDVAWAAHVHPPSRSPLPTEDDFTALAERALNRRGRCFRHALFGFLHAEPVCIEFQVIADPFTRGITVLHRSSDAIAEAADERIQEFISSYR
jgi:hypothetical protein